MWNTCRHSAKSTVYNQYHRSREWLIRSTGAYNERWRKEGCQQTGGEDTIETESGLIWFHASVDKWYQSRRVAFAAKNPDKYHGQTTNLPLWRPWETQSIAALCFTHSNHHRHKFGFFPQQIHPEPHLRKHRLSLSTLPFRQKHQEVGKKKGKKRKKLRLAAIQSKRVKKKPGTLTALQTKLSMFLITQERKKAASAKSVQSQHLPPHWGIITP